MIIVNFGHQITPDQLDAIKATISREIEDVIHKPANFKDDEPFEPQVVRLIESTGIKPHEWESLPLLINLPSYGPIVASLLAYLHGLTGHFPNAIRLRQDRGTGVSVWVLGEILDLNMTRSHARMSKHPLP